jgi:hypothetical protein
MSVGRGRALGLALFLLGLPFAPLFYASAELHRRRGARLRRSFALVEHVERELDESALTLTLVGGHTARVVPSAIAHARLFEWGDGINGSECEVGLVIDDSTRVRGDVWRRTLDPLVDALAEKTTRGGSFAHPDCPSSYLFLYAVLGIAVDAILAGVALACARL